MAPVFQPCILSTQRLVLIPPTATEPVHGPDWFYRAISFMGRRFLAARMVLARCSRSTTMARDLRLYIVSRQPLVPVPPTATGLIQTPRRFYRATPCMGRRLLAGWAVLARYS